MKTLIVKTKWRNEEPKVEEWMCIQETRTMQYLKTLIRAYEKGHITNFTIKTEER